MSWDSALEAKVVRALQAQDRKTASQPLRVSVMAVPSDYIMAGCIPMGLVRATAPPTVLEVTVDVTTYSQALLLAHTSWLSTGYNFLEDIFYSTRANAQSETAWGECMFYFRLPKWDAPHRMFAKVKVKNPKSGNWLYPTSRMIKPLMW